MIALTTEEIFAKALMTIWQEGPAVEPPDGTESFDAQDHADLADQWARWRAAGIAGHALVKAGYLADRDIDPLVVK